MTNAIEMTGVSKHYGRLFTASGATPTLDAVDWRVPRGSITALLGPNGAGKTTCAKLLLGITRASRGDVRVLGVDPARDPLAVRRRTAVVPEDKTGFDRLTVAEFMRYYGSFYDTWQPHAMHALLRTWSIAPSARLGRLSKGTRARLLLGAALARNAELLVLDEPTDGLDPAAREDALQHFLAANAGDRTTLLITHDLSDAERVADRVVILHGGRVLLTGDLDELRTQWKTIRARLRSTARPAHAATPASGIETEWPGARSVERSGDGISIVATDVDRVLATLAAHDAEGIAVSDMSLREIYLAAVASPGGAS